MFMAVNLVKLKALMFNAGTKPTRSKLECCII